MIGHSISKILYISSEVEFVFNLFLHSPPLLDSIAWMEPTKGVEGEASQDQQIVM